MPPNRNFRFLSSKIGAGMTDPMSQYGRYAEEAQKAAFRDALEQGSMEWEGQLQTVPGYLASSAYGGAGQLARLNDRAQRRAISNIARGFTGVAADTARSKRDFAGGILSMREQDRLQRAREKKKKKGFLSTLASLGGTALGFATNPVGTVGSLFSSGVPSGFEESVPGEPWMGYRPR